MNQDALNKFIIQEQELIIDKQQNIIESLQERERLAEGIISNLNQTVEQLYKRLAFYEQS